MLYMREPVITTQWPNKGDYDTLNTARAQSAEAMMLLDHILERMPIDKPLPKLPSDLVRSTAVYLQAVQGFIAANAIYADQRSITE